jgi:hypothetical protein
LEFAAFMKTSTTFTLLVLTLALSAWVLLRERKGPPPNIDGHFLFDYSQRLTTDSGDGEVENNLSAIRPAGKPGQINAGQPADAMASGWEFRARDVLGIDVRSAAGTLALKRRDDSSWDIIKDIKDRAERAFVAQMLKFPTEARILQTIDAAELKADAQAADQYGLDDANAWRVSWKRDGGSKLAEILVGKTAPLGGAVYVRVENERRRPDIYIVSPDLRALLARPLDAFRDPRLTRYTDEQVQRVTIRKGEGEVEFSRASLSEQANAPWVISRPLANAPVFQEGFKDLLSLICSLKVEGTASEPATPTAPATAEAPDKAGIEITLYPSLDLDKKGTSLTFFPDPAGNEKTALCRDRERKTTFRVDKQVVDDLGLLKFPDDLRERKLGDLQASKIFSVHVTPVGGEPVQASRMGDKWWWRPLSGGTFQPAAPERLESLISAINEAEILEFTADSLAEPSLYALDTPAFTVAVGFASHPSLENLSSLSPTTSRTLRIGIAKDGRIFANWTDSPFVYRILPDLPRSIPLTHLKWRSLVLPGYSMQQVRSLSLTAADQPTLVASMTPNTYTWTAQRDGTDVTPGLKISALETLMGKLGALSAAAWLENPSDAAAALAKPAVSLEVQRVIYGDTTATDRVEPIRYEFAPTSTANAPLCYGRVSGAPGLFMIDSAILKLATTSFLDAKRLP